MAIQQAGSVLSFDPGFANSGTVSSTITVPSDAEIVIVAISSYHPSANHFSNGSVTFTKGGVDTAMTVASAAANASTSNWMGCMWYQLAPDVGSNMSLKWNWPGADPTARNVLWSVTFWKGIDTGGAVRDADGAQSASLPVSTPSLTAQSRDKIVAWASLFATSEATVDTWSNLATLSQVSNIASDDCDGAWGVGDPTGNTTVGVSTGTNIPADAAIVAIVLIAAAEPTQTNGPALRLVRSPLRW